MFQILVKECFEKCTEYLCFGWLLFSYNNWNKVCAERLLTLAIRKRYQIGIYTFFVLKTCLIVIWIICILAHAEFEIWCTPGKLSLKVTNMPGRQMFCLRIWPGLFFYSNVKYSVSDKNVGQLIVSLSVVGLVETSWNCFLLRSFYFNVPSNVWFNPIFYDLTYLDFLFHSLFFLFRYEILVPTFWPLFIDFMTQIWVASREKQF